MRHPTFPKPFIHNHSPILNANDLAQEQSFGIRAADFIASLVGSWRFIIFQSVLLMLWIIFNIISIIDHWDPYPFILMNLVLSTQAAFTAPIIMMSQNRQSNKDRIVAQNDYTINQKSEVEIRAVLDHLEAQNEALIALHTMLETLLDQKQIGNSTQG